VSPQARIQAMRLNGSLNRKIETPITERDELWDLHGVDVAIVLKNKSQYYTYRSMDIPTLPPSMAEIVSRSHFPRAQLTFRSKLSIRSRRTFSIKISRREWQKPNLHTTHI
jgi:hypothetical protein